MPFHGRMIETVDNSGAEEIAHRISTRRRGGSSKPREMCREVRTGNDGRSMGEDGPIEEATIEGRRLLTTEDMSRPHTFKRQLRHDL